MTAGSPQNDAPVPRSGQADVELFPRTLVPAEAVHGEDHGGPFEALEAQHVAVEDLVGIPERAPVVLLASLLPLRLFGVAPTGREEGDVFGWP